VACTIMTANTTNRHDNSICPYFYSFLRTSQMNPSLRSGRSVIACLRIAVVPNDRLAIMPSLPHRIRVAGCKDSGNP
jgi:hypothetical protein